jgi:hypothetical protein
MEKHDDENGGQDSTQVEVKEKDPEGEGKLPRVEDRLSKHPNDQAEMEQAVFGPGRKTIGREEYRCQIEKIEDFHFFPCWGLRFGPSGAEGVV